MLRKLQKTKKTILLFVLTTLCSSAFFAHKKDTLYYLGQVEQIMSKLSVHQKVAQLFVIEISRNPSEKTKAFQNSLIKDYGVGGVIIMRGSVYHLMDRIHELQSVANLPLLVTIDAEWGAAMRFEEYLAYPRQAQISRIEKGAEKLLYQMGRNVGKELKDLNIMVNFAPVADVTPGGNNTMGQRAFSHNPHRVSELATAYMKGLQDAGIYACGKHYPGHGGTTTDSHYEMPVIKHSRAHIDSVDLFPYNKLISNGLEMVMIGHMAMPDIDPSGVPMSISNICINQVLKKEQGFKGVVITDAITMAGLTNKNRKAVDATLAVYRAGSDMILMPDNPIDCINAIADSVKAGVFPLNELDNKVRKVLMLKARAGYFENGYSPIVKDLESKVAAAQKRDRKLIKKMRRKMLKSKQPYIEPVGQDRTLLLDKAGK